MKLIHAFGVAFLIFFGVFILYFNLVMALNVVGSNNHITPFLGLFVLDNSRWTSDYYFGFASIFGNGDDIKGILKDLPSAIRFDYTLKMFTDFVESLSGFKKTMDDITNLNYFSGGGSFIEQLQQLGNLLFGLGKIFFGILTSPFRALIAFITLNIELLWTIIDVLQFIWAILNGTYNIPMDNWSSPLEGQVNSNVTTTGVPPVIQITYNGGTISYY